jgi:hypothetical protein
VLLSGTAVLLGARSFRRRGGSMALGTFPGEDRIADAVEERLDVLLPPQVVDGRSHVVQTGRQLLKIGPQGCDRRGIDERRAENLAPRIPAGRRRAMPTDHPVSRPPVDRVPPIGHICMMNLAAGDSQTTASVGSAFVRTTSVAARSGCDPVDRP